MASSKVKMIVHSDGRLEWVVKHFSDDDMLPHEHEEEHEAKTQELLGEIIKGGAVTVRVGNVNGNLEPQSDMEEVSEEEKEALSN
jgi:hypothetical protein